VLRIRDSGIGISPEMLPCVFDLFAQADHSLDRAQGGLGIGLTLIKGLVEMHGGRVQARRDGPGKGSEFEVRLPALPKSYQPTRAIGRAPAASGHAHVLIVEDNADAAESLKMLLEVLGHVAEVVADGPAALEAVSAGDFDAVLVDIGSSWHRWL
jgi:CheY-like chemotaxis protein